MDIDRIRYFHAFVETGSLVKASEILHISQPALSKALKLLESELGLNLLEAEGRGLRLTPAGVLLHQETSHLLSQWFQVADKVKHKGSIEPTRIGTFEVFSTYFLRKLTASIALKALELHEYIPGKLEDAILNNKVDIGVTYLPIPKSGLDFTEITKIKMGAFGLKKYVKKPITDQTFVIPLSPLEGAPSKIIGLDGWPDHKFQRKIAYRVTMMESALELCRQGLAVAYLPNFVVEIHNQMLLPEYRLYELETPIPTKDRLQSVYLVQKVNSEESKLYRQFAGVLRTLK